VSLFRHALRQHGLLDAAWPICSRIRDHLGEDETVWGFKFTPLGVSFELYFYNYAFYTYEFMPDADRNPKSVSTLCKALAPDLHFESTVDESKPYFMCSFELEAATLSKRDGGFFRIYVSSGDKSRRDCGFSYRAERGQLILENHYWFYKPERKGDIQDARRRLMQSPRAGAEGCWPTLMPEALLDCFSVAYSVKPRSDGLYYSRIRTSQLVSFLREHHPGDLCETLAHHEEDFAPLRWDLGFDFCTSPSAGSIAINKLAVYGVL
jgi:hypothetical protein